MVTRAFVAEVSITIFPKKVSHLVRLSGDTQYRTACAPYICFGGDYIYHRDGGPTCLFCAVARTR